MGNKSTQSKIDGLRDQIQEHQAKVLVEEQKTQPDQGKIRHWRHEIDAFTQRMARLERRLQQRRRRGR